MVASIGPRLRVNGNAAKLSEKRWRALRACFTRVVSVGRRM